MRIELTLFGCAAAGVAGAYLAPATVIAAAGGIGFIVGPYLLGAFITSCVAWLVSMPLEIVIDAFQDENRNPITQFFGHLLETCYFLAVVALSAKVGTFLTLTPFMPVLTCALTGAFALIASKWVAQLLLVGLDQLFETEIDFGVEDWIDETLRNDNEGADWEFGL